MLTSLGLGLADLLDRRVLAILARSLGVTLLLFVALAMLAGWLLGGVDPCGVAELSCRLGTIEGALGGILLGLLALWLLFPAVAIGVLWAFADRIVAAVERRHYPAAAGIARPAGLGGNLLLGLRSSLRLLLINLVALPFYLLLLVTGIGPLLLFVAVNGWALGRDLGEMVATRHLDRDGRRLWLLASRGTRTALGIVVTALLLVPFANLLAPVAGVAAATHLFHRRPLNGRASDYPIA